MWFIQSSNLASYYHWSRISFSLSQFVLSLGFSIYFGLEYHKEPAVIFAILFCTFGLILGTLILQEIEIYMIYRETVKTNNLK